MTKHQQDTFTPEEVDTQIDRYLGNDEIQSPAKDEEDLVLRLRKHYQPEGEYTLALKRVQQRLEQHQMSLLAETLEERQKQTLPATQRPAQFQGRPATFRGRRRRFGLLAVATLCVLLIGGTFILLSQARPAARCGENCAASKSAKTSPQNKPIQQYYAVGEYKGNPPGSQTLYRFDPATGKTLWHFTVLPEQDGNGGSGGMSIHPQEVNNVIYFQGTDTDGIYFYALHASDGTLAWRVKMDDPFASMNAPVITNGTVYLTSSNLQTGSSLITAYDATSGHVRWQHPYKGVTEDNANESDGLELIGVDANRLFATQEQILHNQPVWNLYAFNAQTGTQLWAKQYTTIMDAGPVAWQLANGTLYGVVALSPSVKQQTGVSYLTAYDMTNGNTDWSVTLKGTVENLQFTQNTIYALGYDETVNNRPTNLYAIDASNGTTLWKHEVNGDITITVNGGELYEVTNPGGGNGKSFTLTNDGYSAGTPSDQLEALRASDGHQDWQYVPSTSGLILQIELVDTNFVYLNVYGSNQLLLLNRLNGKVVKTITLSSDTQAILRIDGVFLLSSNN